jgi:uncharacterized coiled-coil DUF342 family protein
MIKQSKELKVIKAKLKNRIKAYDTQFAPTYEASIEFFARMDELKYILDWINRKLAQEVKETK